MNPKSATPEHVKTTHVYVHFEGDRVGNIGLGILIGFIVTVGVGIIYPGWGFLLGAFIGGLVAGLIARGIIAGSIAGTLSGLASAIIIGILGFLHVIVVETVQYGFLGFIFGGLAGIVLGIILLILVTILSAIGGFVGGALTR